MRCPFAGSYVALPTPFHRGEIDYPAFKRMIDFHVEHRSDGLVVAGTTGESATLSSHERATLIQTCIEHARGRIRVLAGVGTNSTRTTLELARFSAGAGADGLLVVTPYYNRPSRRGLIAHFSDCAEASSVPIVLYNVPTRTGVDLQPDAVTELYQAHQNIVAIKEASGSIDRARHIHRLCDIALFCGDDVLMADFMAIDGVGAISVVGNLLPEAVGELLRVSVRGGDRKRAGELLEEILPLVRDLHIETNPVPLKTALSLMGFCQAEVRSPLAALEERSLHQLEATLTAAGLVQRRQPVAPSV